MHFCGGGEAHGNEFGGFGDELVGFGFRDAFDGEEGTFGAVCEMLAKVSTDIGVAKSVRICDCFYSVVTGFNNGFDVAGTYAIALEVC